MKHGEIIRAEAFDLMQYLQRAAHDPLLHGVICFSAHISAETLQDAVTLSMEAVPLLGCVLDCSGPRPHWQRQGFSGRDFVRIEAQEADRDAQRTRLLAETIDIAREPQLRITLIRGAETDELVLVMNHMVCDGAGFKEYLYMLAGLYAQREDDPSCQAVPEAVSRSTELLFRDMGLREKLDVLRARYDLSGQRYRAALPLEGDARNALFLTRRIEPEDFRRVRAYAKSAGVTVNDILLTAYIRLLRRVTGESTMTIPCPADLRRFLPEDRKHSISNLTSYFLCRLTVEDDEPFGETLAKVSRQMALRKESKESLQAVLRLEAAFKVFPFWMLRRYFLKVYTIPATSFVNAGVLNKERLRFGSAAPRDMFLTGPLKRRPYFQISVTTYDGACTLSANFAGTENDRRQIEELLGGMAEEIFLFLSAAADPDYSFSRK